MYGSIFYVGPMSIYMEIGLYMELGPMSVSRYVYGARFYVGI